MRLGEKIKKLRQEKQMSQEALARKALISLSYLFKIEKNIHSPTFDVITRIAKALNTSLDSLSEED
ncbi:MAG: helix-turn-helix transcriptional regulator [Candidatus Margulisiibacteriota bacterium]|jgi:hypothetical protein